MVPHLIKHIGLMMADSRSLRKIHVSWMQGPEAASVRGCTYYDGEEETHR